MRKETHTLKRERLNASNRRLTNIFTCGTDQLQSEQKLKTKVVAAEASSAYHCCTHNLSYNSQDCANKLYQFQFSDSAIAAKFSTGRTNMEAIIIKKCSRSRVSETLCRSSSLVSSDASNHKMKRCFLC